MQLWFILSLIFAVLIALFAVANSGEVTLNLVFTQLPANQSVIILASAAIGAIIASFFGVFKKLKASLKVRDLNHQIKELQSKIENLQNENGELLAKSNAEKEAAIIKQHLATEESKNENRAEETTNNES